MPMRRRRSDNASDDEPFELAALADGSLSQERRSQLEARVAASAELGELLAEQQEAVALTRSVVAEVEAPAGLRQRLEAQRQPRTTSAPRRLAIAGATAAVVAAAAIGAVALSSGGSGSAFRAALAPTSLAPEAHGKATLTRRPSGWQVKLNAAGLPRLANGAFYEAWLRNDAGVLVPIGTFNDGRNVTLWAGVAPTQFTTLTVTREQADGDQSSSGEKVLVGAVTHG
ncbi:MAG TPA: anti-sigma factor [Gaiellaceae bacterium]|jgi:anti-sigma factor RsiW